jgi:hypothetical protein
MAPHGLIEEPSDYAIYLDAWLADKAGQKMLRDWKVDACVGSSVAASRLGYAYPRARALECIAWAALWVDTPQEIDGLMMANRSLDECERWLSEGGIQVS